MDSQHRDIKAISQISFCCDKINATIVLFGRDLNLFKGNYTYQDACAMNIVQIGEMANRLSEKFRNEHPEIPWNFIRGMRNVFAHEYECMDVLRMWQTLMEDIPVLKDFCNKVLGQNN